eukprot:2873571-Amphidinium_carterae.1
MSAATAGIRPGVVQAGSQQTTVSNFENLPRCHHCHWDTRLCLLPRASNTNKHADTYDADNLEHLKLGTAAKQPQTEHV